MGLFIFNRIRMFFNDDIERLKPLVQDAYRRIHEFQLNRTNKNEMILRESIAAATSILAKFVEHIPAYKGKYIQILQREEDLNPSDLIICFDRAIYELHLYVTLGRSGTYAKLPWSRELRAFLDERQAFEKSSDEERTETFLVNGKPACPGEAEGPAVVTLTKDDFKRVTKGSILVAPMTTPDIRINN
jgi:hypothetical protein